MSKEERQALRLQAKIQTERMQKAVDDLVKKNGWTLTPERRDQLFERYVQERNKVEEVLRKETEERRRPMIAELVEKLKAEFNPENAPSPTPAAAATSSLP